MTLCLIRQYQKTRAANLASLPMAVARIPEGSVIWGAGRLLDAIVRYGGLDRSKHVVVDTALAPLGLAEYPDRLAELQPPCIVVMSRMHADQISSLARTMCPGARIVTYAELVA